MQYVQKSGSSERFYLLDGQGFVYASDRVAQNRVYWRCTWKRQFKCPGRAVTISHRLTRLAGMHNHESNLTNEYYYCDQFVAKAKFD